MFNIFKRINYINSSTTVQCNAIRACEMRHSEMCKTCGHNCGPKKDKNCYKPRKTKNN